MTVTDFRIGVEPMDHGVVRVALAGDVDARHAPELKRQLHDLIDEGNSRLLIDLCDAVFIDSTALGVVLGAVRELRDRRGRLAVLCPDRSMQELFELLGHNMIFPVEDDVEKALRHLGGRRRLPTRRRRHSEGALTDWKRRS